MTRAKTTNNKQRKKRKNVGHAQQHTRVQACLKITEYGAHVFAEPSDAEESHKRLVPALLISRIFRDDLDAMLSLEQQHIGAFSPDDGSSIVVADGKTEAHVVVIL